MKTNFHSDGPQIRSAPTRATLILLTAISVLTLNLFLPSLPSMARDFDVSYSAVSFTIAGYVGLSAALSLVLGPVSDKFGRRPVLLISFSIFALASLGAALTQNFTLFLIFRMVQAASATGSILSRAIVRDIFPPDKGTSVLGYISMAMAIAPMLGPLIGGVMEELLGWRSVFWLFALMGALAVCLIWFDLGETAGGRGIGIEEQLKGYGIVLRSKVFWSNALVAGFSIMAFFIFLAGVPLVASTTFNLGPSRVGLSLGVISAGFFIGSFLTGRYAERFSLGALMIWGRRIALIGPAAALLLVILDVATPAVFFGLMITLGLGNGLSIPSATTGSMSVRPDLAGSASGLSAALSMALGAGGSAITGALLSAQNATWMLCTILICACVGALISAHLAACAEKTAKFAA